MLPEIKRPDGIRKQVQMQFGGVDRRPGAADGTFYDTARLSTEKAPLLTARAPYSYQVNHTDYVFGNDALLEIRNRDEIYYNGWALCSLGQTQNLHRAVRFGHDWILFPDKVLLHIPGILKGRVESSAALSSIESPQEGDIWAVGASNETNPYLYTRQGNDWVQGERVMRSLEASVTLAIGDAAFESGTYAGESADMNTLRFASSGRSWSDYFKAGDSVQISGCVRQPKNNQRLIIREIDGDKLRFYENSFYRENDVEVCEVQAGGLPREVPDEPGEYNLYWYKGDFFSARLNFVLPAAAPEGSALVFSQAAGLDLVFENGSAMHVTLYADKPPHAYGEAPEELSFTQKDEDTYHRSLIEVNSVRVARTLPDMDYIFGDSNRLWGCKQSTIYASKLGDPSNFYAFDGLSDDSWSVEVFSPGEFTGAISHNGYPTFFKETIRYKVYGQTPEAYQLSELSCVGVREGCAGSMAILSDVLYYVSRDGIMADSGSLPRCISRQLHGMTFSDAQGVCSDKLYVLSGSADNEAPHHRSQTYVYDTECGIWLHDEERRYDGFTCVLGTIYGLLSSGNLVRFASAASGDGWTNEGTVSSELVTNDYTLGELNRKRVHRLQIRAEVEQGASLTISIRYNGGAWQSVRTISDGPKQSYYIPIKLKRCDHFALKFAGSGAWTLHALALETKVGSEIH